MNLQILNERTNPLLHRTEINCVMEYDGTTPARKELIKAISAKRGVKENLVIVDAIRQEFGKKRAKCYVKIYQSEKSMQLVEAKHQIKRGSSEKKGKAAAAAAGAAAPAEEKKEEKPAEAKQEAKQEAKPAAKVQNKPEEVKK